MDIPILTAVKNNIYSYGFDNIDEWTEFLNGLKKVVEG